MRVFALLCLLLPALAEAQPRFVEPRMTRPPVAARRPPPPHQAYRLRADSDCLLGCSAAGNDERTCLTVCDDEALLAQGKRDLRK